MAADGVLEEGNPIDVEVDVVLLVVAVVDAGFAKVDDDFVVVVDGGGGIICCLSVWLNISISCI